MIPRSLSNIIKQEAGKMPVISVTGPRQSGKTTLVKAIFPDYTYVNLENIENRTFAQNDPTSFLRTYNHKIIFDEIQNVPELFSYLQEIVDNSKKKGQFILTGSQNFLLHEKISQSLAGRVSIFYLLPFSFNELKSSAYEYDDYMPYLLNGFYPRIYDQNLTPHRWYEDYIQTYIERDVRQLKAVGNLTKFQQFLKLCAGRTGQLLNLSSLANDLGIDHKTVRSWISVLEASFIVFLLPPFHRNFNKRVIKTPKLYFFDTGLVCSILGIRNKEQLNVHYMKGELFETFMISELYKIFLNRGERPPLYFWRDNTGNEIDCVIESGGTISGVEIKSGITINPDFFKGLIFWQKLTGNNTNWLLYGGNENQYRSDGNTVAWKDVIKITDPLI
jgi:uncharacterized protein